MNLLYSLLYSYYFFKRFNFILLVLKPSNRDSKILKKEGFTILQGMALLLLKPLDLPANYSLNLIIWITNPKNKINLK